MRESCKYIYTRNAHRIDVKILYETSLLQYFCALFWLPGTLGLSILVRELPGILRNHGQGQPSYSK